MFEDLCVSLSHLPEVEALALGGSRVGANYDGSSDYDLYVYVSKLPSETVRRSLLEKHCQYIELGNAFWEVEDDAILKNGIAIDIVYRDLAAIEAGLVATVENCQAANGYTTCIWYNVTNSRILYDAKGKYRALQERFDVPYPVGLKKAIIERNWRLLTGNLPSYDEQILKAAKREDWLSVNHRVAAYLESYMDIIFALNNCKHPGEKRMMTYAKKEAKDLPDDFEATVNHLLSHMVGQPNILAADLKKLTHSMKNLLEQSYQGNVSL